jgi:phosphoadenosine phosphosulfate reductase
VAFSGGKDSIVVLDLVRKAGVLHDAHMNMTSIDPAELVRFVKKYYPDVKRHAPELSMWKLIEHKMSPPTRKVRYCCDILKEHGGEGRFTITGVRWAESPKRAARKMVETCYRLPGKTFLRPIIDWSDEDVWEYIRSNNLPYPSLYDEGFKRIGCIGCPMSSNRKKEFKRWPKVEQRWKKAIYKAAQRRKENGWSRNINKEHPKWATDGAKMWSWWMEENKQPSYNDQRVMFE